MARPPLIAGMWWPPVVLTAMLVLWLAGGTRDVREGPSPPATAAWWWVAVASGGVGDATAVAAAVPSLRPVAGEAAVPKAAPDDASGVADAEICGFGRVQRAPDDPDVLQQVPLEQRRAALATVESRMLASDDEQVRAAARLIGGRWGDGAGGDAQSHHAYLVQLVHQALGSRDPTVYAMALDACLGATVAECALLSHAQWARLDPDNVQPWLALAAEARQQHDGESEAEAMRQASRARRSDFPSGLLPHLVDRALGPRVPPLQRTLGLSLGVSVQAAWRPSHSVQADVWCVAEEAGVPDRREVCDALAQTLAFGSTSVADLTLGLSIGRRLGWPTPRLESLQQEQDAISETGAFTEVGIDWSCAAVERLSATFARLATGGELQSVRATVARSGRSIAAWSAEHRRNLAAAEAAANAATLATIAP
jgi:hypothetical protein